MILLIDNYDSFSYNLFQQAAAIQPDMRVVRNDALTVAGNNHYRKTDGTIVKFDCERFPGCPTEKISISNDLIDVKEKVSRRAR